MILLFILHQQGHTVFTGEAPAPAGGGGRKRKPTRARGGLAAWMLSLFS